MDLQDEEQQALRKQDACFTAESAGHNLTMKDRQAGSIYQGQAVGLSYSGVRCAGLGSPYQPSCKLD